MAISGRELAQVFVRLKPDDTGFESDAKVQLKRSTKGLGVKVPIDADTTPATAKVDELKARVGLLSASAAKIRLAVTGDKDAESKALKLQATLMRLGRTVTPDISAEGMLDAEARVLGIEHSLDKIDGRRVTAHVSIKTSLLSKASGLLGGGAGGSGGLVGSLGSLAGAGTTLINPITIAAGGLAAIMAGPLLASFLPITAGFVGLAAVAVPELTKIWTAVGKGPKAIAALSPAEQKVAGDLKALKGEFGGLAKAVRPEVLTAFGTGLTIIHRLMPALRPLLQAAGDAANYFLSQLANWLKSPSGKKFLSWLETQGPKDIRTFGVVMWTMAQVVGRVFSFLLNAGNTWWKNVKYTTGLIQAAYRNLRNWIGSDFVDKLVTFFTKTIPTAFDLFLLYAKRTWLQLEASTLQAVYKITGIWGKLPGPLGAPFRAAHKAIGSELAGIQGDVARTSAKINDDWQKLHGKKVALTFGLNLPAGVSYPSRPIKGRGAKGITGAAAGTWLVGEEGPELAYLPQGTNVLPAKPTARIMGGLAGGTGFGISDVFNPSAGVFGAQLSTAFSKAEAAVIASVRARAKVTASAFGGVTSGALGGDERANQALARSLFPWPASMWPAYVSLEMREAGFNRFATNPTSGAYGIPQALPPTKMPFAAQAAGGSHAGPQLSWQYGYIGSTYGNPLNAWAHEQSAGWYGNGGTITEPVVGVGASGRRYGFGERGPEVVTPQSDSKTLIALTRAMLRELSGAPERTGNAVGDTLNGVAKKAAYAGLY